MTEGDVAFVYWLDVEYVSIAGLVVTNVIFFLVRSIVRHKVNSTTNLS